MALIERRCRNVKEKIVLVEDINNKTFRIGDLVKVRILDMFGNDDTVGRIMEIHNDRIILDTSVEYCADQKTINLGKVHSIDKVE